MAAIATLCAAALLLVAACGGDDDDGTAAPSGIFVGTVEGTDAYIGLKSDGEQAAGYLCNGQEGVSESELVSVWLDESSISDGSAELVSRKGEVVGEVTFSDDGAAGEVEVEGESHPFSAEPASAEAGIARQVEGEPGEPGFEELGWVVLNDGSFRGAKTATTQSGTSSFMDTNTLKKPTTGYIDPVHNL